MSKPLYFAYGSNLSAAQMAARCPGAALVGRAVLPNHELSFAGYSAGWEGAVANVERRPGGQVQGVVYQLSRRALARLDRFEGAPYCYRREQRRVLTEFGSWRWVFIYVQQDAPSGRPSLLYLATIVQEYRRREFDLGPLALAASMKEESDVCVRVRVAHEGAAEPQAAAQREVRQLGPHGTKVHHGLSRGVSRGRSWGDYLRARGSL